MVPSSTPSSYSLPCLHSFLHPSLLTASRPVLTFLSLMPHIAQTTHRLSHHHITFHCITSYHIASQQERERGSERGSEMSGAMRGQQRRKRASEEERERGREGHHLYYKDDSTSFLMNIQDCTTGPTFQKACSSTNRSATSL